MPENETPNDSAEFDALLAELSSEDTSEDPGDSGGPTGPEDLEDPSEETEEALEDEPEEDAPEAPADLSAADLLKLIEEGDLTAGGRLDPKLFKISNKQYRAMRTGLADAKKLAEEATAKEQAATQLRAAAEAEFGMIAAGSKAAREGDWTKAQAALELQFNRPFNEIVASIARAAKGLDPAQVEVNKLRQELAEKARAEAEAKTKAEGEAAYKADCKATLGRLKGTPLEGVEEAAEDIVKLVRASLDPRTNRYSKTVKEAYAEVKAAYAAKAAKLARLAPTTPAKPPARAPLRPVRREAPKTPAEKQADLDAEFAASVAEAAKEAEAQARSRRRSGRAR